LEVLTRLQTVDWSRRLQLRNSAQWRDGRRFCCKRAWPRAQGRGSTFFFFFFSLQQSLSNRSVVLKTGVSPRPAINLVDWLVCNNAQSRLSVENDTVRGYVAVHALFGGATMAPLAEILQTRTAMIRRAVATFSLPLRQTVARRRFLLWRSPLPQQRSTASIGSAGAVPCDYCPAVFPAAWATWPVQYIQSLWMGACPGGALTYAHESAPCLSRLKLRTSGWPADGTADVARFSPGSRTQ